MSSWRREELLRRRDETNRRLRAHQEQIDAALRSMDAAVADFRQRDAELQRHRALSSRETRQPTPLEVWQLQQTHSSSHPSRSQAEVATQQLATARATPTSSSFFNESAAAASAWDSPAVSRSGLVSARDVYRQTLIARGVAFSPIAAADIGEQRQQQAAAEFDAAAAAGEGVLLQRAATIEEITEGLRAVEVAEKEDDASDARAVAAVLVARKKKEEEAKKPTPLPAEHVERFQEILRAPRSEDGQQVVEFYKYRLTQKDLKTLRPRTWLNDEVVNAFLWLIDDEQPKVFAHTTFFLTTFMGNRGYAAVRRWTSRRKVDLFAMELVLVPVNIHNSHWTLVAANLLEKTITYYDSMSGDGSKYLHAVMDYLVAEFKDKKGGELDSSDWRLQSSPPGIRVPQQNNGSDCGAFTCICAMHLARRLPLMYHQREMSGHWRPFIASSLLAATALPR